MGGLVLVLVLVGVLYFPQDKAPASTSTQPLVPTHLPIPLQKMNLTHPVSSLTPNGTKVRYNTRTID